MRERYGNFEQLVQATLRSEQEASGGALRYHSSPLKEDRRYYFLTGANGSFQVASIAGTDDALWTLVNHDWPDQSTSWSQFQGHERNEAFLRMKIRELRVRLGLPWRQDSNAS